MIRRQAIQVVVTAAVITVAAVLFSVLLLAAQSSPSVVAVLIPGAAYKAVLEGLREGLSKVGFSEEANIRFIVEEAGRERESYESAAVKLVGAKPDVIVAVTSASTAAARKATTVIPIVFTSIGAPVEAGLVASFASSGNNLAGISSYAIPLSGKRLELLREITPRSKKVLVIVSVKEPISQIGAQHTEAAAKKFGVQIVRREVANAEDIEKVLVGRWAGAADAVLAVPSVLTQAKYIEEMIKKANGERLPLIAYEDTLVTMGALGSYGSNRHLTGLQAAKLVAKLLKGAKPSDLPIETPDRFILSVNLATAKAIGIKIPRSVLERADRLVE
jgi:putative ABC transport system substrate-binding protein